MADDQVIGVLEFRFDEEDGIVVVSFGGDEGIRIDRSVPPDPRVLLVFGWFAVTGKKTEMADEQA